MKRFGFWIFVLVMVLVILGGCGAPDVKVEEKQVPEPTLRPIKDFLYPTPGTWVRDYGDTAEVQLYHNVAVLLAWVRQYEPEIERQRIALQGFVDDVNDPNMTDIEEKLNAAIHKSDFVYEAIDKVFEMAAEIDRWSKQTDERLAMLEAPLLRALRTTFDVNDVNEVSL